MTDQVSMTGNLYAALLAAARPTRCQHGALAGWRRRVVVVLVVVGRGGGVLITARGAVQHGPYTDRLRHRHMLIVTDTPMHRATHRQDCM